VLTNKISVSAIPIKIRSKQTEICIRVLPYGYCCVDVLPYGYCCVDIGEIDGPDLDGILGAGGRDRGRAHTKRERAQSYDFQCAKIMNSSGNEIVTGTPKRKSLLSNSKVVHAKSQR
jgi:hypothetical protein